MKVVYRGELPAEKWYKATCSHCTSVMEFQKREVQWHSDQRDGDYVLFECPVCKKTVNSSPKQIPTPKPYPDYGPR